MIKLEELINCDWDLVGNKNVNYYPKYISAQNNDAQIKNRIKKQGYCILRYNLKTLNESITLLDKLFSRKLPQSKDHNNLIVNVTPQKNSRRILHSSKSQLLHVDYGDNNIQPEIVALICEKKSHFGGDSIIVHINTVLTYIQSLGLSDELYSLLIGDRTVVYERGNNSRLGRIFFKNESGHLCFSLRYADRIYCKVEKLKSILIKIVEFCHLHESQIRFNLRIGDILLLDNYKVIHGRSRFCGDRKMIRVWYKGYDS